jgi:hypothetical protein
MSRIILCCVWSLLVHIVALSFLVVVIVMDVHQFGQRVCRQLIAYIPSVNSSAVVEVLYYSVASEIVGLVVLRSL